MMQFEQTVPANSTTYSPVLTRGGDRAVIAFQVIEIDSSGGGDLAIELEHKNSEDTGFSSVGASVTTSSQGITVVKNTDSQLFKEMVRVKYTDGTGKDVRVEMLKPSWLDDQ